MKIWKIGLGVGRGSFHVEAATEKDAREIAAMMGVGEPVTAEALTLAEERALRMSLESDERAHEDEGGAP